MTDVSGYLQEGGSGHCSHNYNHGLNFHCPQFDFHDLDYTSYIQAVNVESRQLHVYRIHACETGGVLCNMEYHCRDQIL